MAEVKPAVAKGLSDIISIMTQANIAIPVIGTTVGAMLAIIKALKGDAPSFAELERQILAQAEANRQRGEAELARLRAQL